MGANFVIASNVIPFTNKSSMEINNLQTKNKIEIPNIFTVIFQATEIMHKKMVRDSLPDADIVINSGTFGIKDIEFYRAEEIMEKGIKSARKVLTGMKKF